MAADMVVLHERLAAQEQANARLTGQLSVAVAQNKHLRTAIVGLEASLERRGKELQALAGLVDVDDPLLARQSCIKDMTRIGRSHPAGLLVAIQRKYIGTQCRVKEGGVEPVAQTRRALPTRRATKERSRSSS